MDHAIEFSDAGSAYVNDEVMVPLQVMCKPQARQMRHCVLLNAKKLPHELSNQLYVRVQKFGVHNYARYCMSTMQVTLKDRGRQGLP